MITLHLHSILTKIFQIIIIKKAFKFSHDMMIMIMIAEMPTNYDIINLTCDQKNYEKISRTHRSAGSYN